MKTVTGRVISAEPISLSKAATILSGFVSSDNGASQDVSAYLRRAAAAFTELKSLHREINSSSLKGKKKPRSEARNERNRTDEFEELDRAMGTDELVGNGGEIRFRKSEIVREEESICGREQDEIKEDKKKKKKKKSKKNIEEDVVDEKVKEKLEDEQRNEERKKKSKKNKVEDVTDDEKVNERLEEEQGEERKKEKKKRKSDGETGSDERKSKKKRKSKEIDG